MAKEIELKFRVDDPDGFRLRLSTKASSLGPYHKDDTYFRGADGSFRLREANGEVVVCRKEKTIDGGIEVNRETEFRIDDPGAFRAFAKSLGYREWYRKVKDGEAWRWGDILIELGTVSDLGWFAELELILDEGQDARSIERARRTLLAAIDSLNVPRESMETRTYSQLLGHRGR